MVTQNRNVCRIDRIVIVCSRASVQFIGRVKRSNTFVTNKAGKLSGDGIAPTAVAHY
jgi:hypothetical protein